MLAPISGAEMEEKRACVPALLGLAEAAELLAISKAVLWERRRRAYLPGDRLPPFPAPLAELRCGPVWSRDAIEAYRAEAERLASFSWYERRYREGAA